MIIYQGWTNRATWNVSLWINNDEILYTRVQKVLKACGGSIGAQELENMMCTLFPKRMTPDGDLFSDANWGEIARSMNEL